ncbi:MAG: SIS domain-containing protein [Erysipelotrichaceae bacterium]|nr:SIS domain-containing protein [Erysipelotrichaceae bacterium]
MEKPSMSGYINDQPRALRSTFENRRIFTDPFDEIFGKGKFRKIFILGSGTSWHASIAAAYYFEKYLGVEAEADIPTHFTNYTKLHGNTAEILVIGISQSGTSVSTIEAVRKAEKAGCVTVAVTDAMDSLITKETPNVIKLTCGVEEIPIETRGYSVTVLEMYLTALSAARTWQTLSREEYERLMEKTSRVLELHAGALEQVNDWYRANQQELLGMTHGVIAAYGLNECTAREGVLKLYETFKQPMNSYDIEEMIHGPQMAFKDSTYVFISASTETEYPKVPKFLQWFKDNEVTEHVFLFTNGTMETDEKGIRFDSEIPDDLTPLFFTLPYQVMAAENCIACGIDTSVRPARRKAFAHIYREDQE